MKTQIKTVSRIEELENQISLIQEEIIAHEAEIEEFEISLNMLQTHEGWRPAENSSTFEMLRSLITSEPEEAQRKNRIAQSSVALEASKKNLAQKKNTAEMLGELLSAEQAEEVWQRQYQPFVARFESGYQEEADPRVTRIQQLEKDIAQFRPQLAAASEWVQAPDYAKPKYFYSRDPKGDAEYLPSAIQVREEMLENLRSQPPAPRDEKKFRSYIAARTEIEQPLQHLLSAQKQYAEALAEFKAASTGREAALGFSIEELAELPQVVAIADNRIILTKGSNNG